MTLLPETELLWQLSQSEKHRHLLKHPLITLFLWLKWQRINVYYNANLILYIVFVACLTTYIFCTHGGRSLNVDCNEDANSMVSALWYINVFLVVIFLLRELLQVLLLPARRYFGSFENWLEMILLALTISMLTSNEKCDGSTQRHVAAIIIISSWSEIITMLGKHPMFGSYNSYVTMFYKVLSSFITFLTW